MAANRTPKSIGDLNRWDAVLRVTCRRCPHSALFDVDAVTTYFVKRGWNTSWYGVGRRFRCLHCLTRSAEISMAPRPLLPGGLATPRAFTETEVRAAMKRMR